MNNWEKKLAPQDNIRVSVQRNEDIIYMVLYLRNYFKHYFIQLTLNSADVTDKEPFCHCATKTCMTLWACIFHRYRAYPHQLLHIKHTFFFILSVLCILYIVQKAEKS